MSWSGITPLSRAVLRFDDYHQSIDHETWVRVLSEYDDRGLRGVVGVIPSYHGEPLSSDVVPFLKRLSENGWEIAQHGYRHVNVGTGRAGLFYQDQSEFAGLNYDEQERRIGAGKDILRDHGLDPTTFIPPWHEYDRDTLRALNTQGFDCLNEGRLPLPRTVSDITLVPTHIPVITPAIAAMGTVTLVSHPHLDDDPYRAADIIAGHESKLRVPSEIAKWWRQKPSMFGSRHR